MADDAANNHSGPFDVHTITALVRLMAEHDLNEIDLRDGAVRVRLLRGVTRGAAVAPVLAAAPAAASAPREAAASKEPAGAAPPARKLIDIKSPSVGTFYGAANPEAPPFVRVGDRVTPTTVVGLVEAMKTFNEIPADCSGLVVEQLVRNGEGIEFDTVLFRVDPGA